MKQKLFLGILILSLILNAVFISRKIYFYLHYKPKPVLSSKTSAQLFKELYKYSPKRESQIVFLGNSITAAFQIVEFLPGYNILNRGISGNTTTDILNRIIDVADKKPDKIFIMIGINDIVENVSLKEIMKNYQLILDEIKNGSPETKLYIQSILPVTRHASNCFSGDDHKINQMIVEANNSLYKLTTERGLTYIDLHSVFKANDELKDDYSWDGIHVNAKGYEQWFEHIKPYIVITEQQ